MRSNVRRPSLCGTRAPSVVLDRRGHQCGEVPSVGLESHGILLFDLERDAGAIDFPCELVRHEILRRSATCADHWQPARRRFQYRYIEPFSAVGRNVDVGGLVELGHGPMR